MKSLLLRTASLLGLCLFSLSLLVGQDGKASAPAQAPSQAPAQGIDLSGLSPAQKTLAMKILKDHDCPCGCGMKVADCRVADPSCSYSAGLTDVVISSVKRGKTEAQVRAEMDASKWAHVQPPKVLDDPVNIPVTGAPETGAKAGLVTLVEFSDFQCPYCAAAVPQIKAILQAYPTQVKLVFKQFPLQIHPQADLAAAAAVAAQKQGKFWPLHDAMYSTQDDLSRKSIMASAKKVGLDMKRFETDIDSTEVREAVVRDVQDGNKAGVEGTPTIFVNGQKYNGAINLSILKPILDAELKPPTVKK